jgi:hypothetical protein
MIAWKRAVPLGFLSWLIPFMISFLIFPLKRTNAPLFGALMGLIVLFTAGALLNVYFRKTPLTVGEAVVTGGLWFAMNLAFDYPMFAYGPMRMTASAYIRKSAWSIWRFRCSACWPRIWRDIRASDDSVTRTGAGPGKSLRWLDVRAEVNASCVRRERARRKRAACGGGDPARRPHRFRAHAAR